MQLSSYIAEVSKTNFYVTFQRYLKYNLTRAKVSGKIKRQTENMAFKTLV